MYFKWKHNFQRSSLIIAVYIRTLKKKTQWGRDERMHNFATFGRYRCVLPVRPQLHSQRTMRPCCFPDGNEEKKDEVVHNWHTFAQPQETSWSVRRRRRQQKVNDSAQWRRRRAATKSERQCFHFIPQKSRCITNTQRMQQPQYYIRPYVYTRGLVLQWYRSLQIAAA